MLITPILIISKQEVLGLLLEKLYSNKTGGSDFVNNRQDRRFAYDIGYWLAGLTHCDCRLNKSLIIYSINYIINYKTFVDKHNTWFLLTNIPISDIIGGPVGRILRLFASIIAPVLLKFKNIPRIAAQCHSFGKLIVSYLFIKRVARKYYQVTNLYLLLAICLSMLFLLWFINI